MRREPAHTRAIFHPKETSMSETRPTVKVKTDAPDNADGFIVINESDFDPKVHELHEAKVAKPSDGLTSDELKAALTAKSVAIPAGAKKADLAALLDAA
jgi:hypothetical protein